jgi:hypothetical protein
MMSGHHVGHVAGQQGKVLFARSQHDAGVVLAPEPPVVVAPVKNVDEYEHGEYAQVWQVQ